MEHSHGDMNGGFGAFTFEMQDPLSEDDNEDIHHAVKYSILQLNSAESNYVESVYTEEDEHIGSTEGPTRQMRKKSMTSGKAWWRKLYSSLNIFKKFKQFNVTSWESSPSEWDSNCQSDQICDVCDEPIFSNRLTRSFWGQTVCHKHLLDGTPMCCSCSRIKLGNTRYINLSDGRKLCPDCHRTAIMDTKTCIPLFHDVYRFFEGLNMKIIEDIPIFLVDKDEINKIYCREKDKPGYLLGLTTYEAGLLVRSVVGSYQRGQNIHVVKEAQYIQRIYEVTSLLILYGFPRLAIGATLAHEMMHAWMRIEGYRGLKEEVAEGICQVMAHKWLDWHAFIGDDFLHTTPEQVQFLRNLKELLKYGIEANYSKIYGGGFRDAKWAVERYGLKYTMFHVARTGNFPQ